MSNNIIITGIPRSGTSYLCSLLNKTRNTVVINEPEEVFHVLHNDSRVSLADYYGGLRRQIINRVPISNKIVNGRFIEDTNIIDARNTYLPEIDDDDFTLGTKNTLIYLSCLEKIRGTFPDCKIIACVRHPCDAIASWKKVSFPHIKYAAAWHLENYVTDAQWKIILQVFSVRELDARYALWWNHMAERLIKFTGQIDVIRYEDMVTGPGMTLSRLSDAIGTSLEAKSQITPSSNRRHDGELSPGETDRISTVCRTSAAYFGYTL